MSSLRISGPLEVRHVLHIDKNLNWEFDESTDANSAFVKKREIGKGGFGTVCELEHVESGSIFAGKVISPEVLNRSTKESLMHEIALMRQIRTPFTISYYGSVLYENSVMLMMEYCDRGSLRDCMDFLRVRLNENQVKIVMHDLLMGISLLHKKYQIIHRDIKAANILLTRDGKLRVTDFGVSKQFDVGKTVNTCSVIGTPYWMAPEVVFGMKYSYPADIWSVGATAVELIEGLPPYGEYSIMKAIVEIGKVGFAGFRKGTRVSRKMKDFVLKCLVKDVKVRATPEELLRHPFLKGVEDLDRMEVLGPLLKRDIDFGKLMEAQEKMASGVESEVPEFGDAEDEEEEEEVEEEEEEEEEQLVNVQQAFETFRAKTSRVQAFVTKAGEVEVEEKFPNLLVEMSRLELPKSSGVVAPASLSLFVFAFLLLKKFGLIGFLIIMIVPVMAVYYFEQDILWSKELQTPKEIK